MGGLVLSAAVAGGRAKAARSSGNEAALELGGGRLRVPGAAVGRLVWLWPLPQNDSSEVPGCRPAQKREGMGKKGLSAPTSAPVKGEGSG